VRDTGKGIEAKQLSQIFTSAVVTHSIRQPQEGLGIGLIIVRNLVELQGGAVHAESAGPGRGATFTVTLPVTDERPAGEAEAVGIVARALASGRLPSLNSVRVLVVDDAPDSRELMKAILAQCGAEVRSRRRPGWRWRRSKRHHSMSWSATSQCRKKTVTI